MALDAEDPTCLESDRDFAEHHWDSPLSIVGGIKENPGVFGKGGGVVCTTVCLRCGCRRTVDTWSNGPSGQQGLTTEEYEPGHYADEVRSLQIEEAVRHLEAKRKRYEAAGGWYSDEEILYTSEDGHRMMASDDEMAEYGMALLCGKDAELPGEEAPEEEKE